MVVTGQPAARGQLLTVSRKEISLFSTKSKQEGKSMLDLAWLVTCSWSSANRCARSSSESSVEDSDSEDESLELSDDEATGGGWGLTGAGW